MPERKLYVKSLRLDSVELTTFFSRFGEVFDVDVGTGGHFAFVEMRSPEDARRALVGSTWSPLNGAFLHVEPKQTAGAKPPRDVLEQLRGRAGTGSGPWLAQLSPWQLELLADDAELFSRWLSAVTTPRQPSPEPAAPEPQAPAVSVWHALPPASETLLRFRATGEALRQLVARCGYGAVRFLAERGGFTQVAFADPAAASRALRECSWQTLDGLPVFVEVDGLPAPVDPLTELKLRLGVTPALAQWLAALSVFQRAALCDDLGLWAQFMKQVTPRPVLPAASASAPAQPAGGRKDATLQHLIVRASTTKISELRRHFELYGRLARIKMADGECHIAFPDPAIADRALRESSYASIQGPVFVELENAQPQPQPRDLEPPPRRTQLLPAQAAWLDRLSASQRRALATDDALWAKWLAEVPPRGAAPAAAPSPDDAALAFTASEATRSVLASAATIPEAKVRSFFAQAGPVQRLAIAGSRALVVFIEPTAVDRAIQVSTWLDLAGPVAVAPASSARVPHDAPRALKRRPGVSTSQAAWLDGLSAWQREQLALRQELWTEFIRRVA